MSNVLQPPLVPANLDVRDEPIPVELFAQLAAVQFGISLDEARAHAEDVVARMERDASRRRSR